MKAITREWLEWKIDVTSVQTVQLAYKPRHPADVYTTRACQVWLCSPH